MSNLVLLRDEREKREQADQAKLVAGLQELWRWQRTVRLKPSATPH